MSLNASKVRGKAGSKQKPLVAGSYPARIVAVIDLGLQAQRPYLGQEKEPAREIMITYELLDEFVEGEDGKPDESKPRWVSETMPLHNLKADKAKSTRRYMALDPDVVHGGDWTKLLGKACLATIVVNPGKGANAGKVFNNIGEIAAMRPKDEANAPPLVNESYFFDLDDPNIEVFNSFPDFIKDKLKANLEYNGSALQAALGEKKAEQAEEESANDGIPSGGF